MKLRVLSTTGGKLKKYFSQVTTDFGQLVAWLEPIDDFIALDLETNMVDSILDRHITTIALYYDNVVWVIFFDELEYENMQILNSILGTKRYIIQNAIFEIKTFKRYNVPINRFYDTFIAEKALNMGLDAAKNSLEGILKKYLNINLDKEFQTSFDESKTITDEQLEYVIKDVIYLHKVKELQEEHISYHDKVLQSKLVSSKNRGLKKAIWWSTEFIKVIAELEYEGMRLDVPAWKALYEEALPLVAKAEAGINAIVKSDFYTRAVASEFLYAKDTFVPKLFTSAARKKELLSIIYPDIEKTSQLELKQYLLKNDPDWPEGIKATSKKIGPYIRDIDVTKSKFIAIKLLLANRFYDVKKLFYVNFYDELVKRGLLIPAGTVHINWASPTQRLEIFRWIVPELASTERKYMEEVAYKHRLLQDYLDHYQKYIGLTTKFGLNYIKSVEADGKIRTHINPMINTGRISSSKPNVLNVVADKRYRACFIADEGYKYVMTDYVSEELVIVSHFSGQKAWTDAIRSKHDLHSVNASVMLKKEWDAATEIDCEFVKTKRKCNCKQHKVLRSNSKSASFGAIYGISKFGLAFQLHSSDEHADTILKKFFLGVPNIDKFLKHKAQYALNNLYAYENVLGACRFVDKRMLHYDRNSVKRTSANFSVQGSGASILKIATVLIRRHAIQMGHKATIVNIPYDEIIMHVTEDVAEYWKIKLQYFMELAGKLALKTDILKTDPCIIANHWVH